MSTELLYIFNIIVFFFIAGGILFGVTRLGKIEEASYKKSLIILIIFGIVGIVTREVFSLAELQFFANIAPVLIGAFFFYYLFKKCYQANWKKSLIVYVVFILIIISFTTIFRFYFINHAFVRGDAMSPTYNQGNYLLINRLNKDFNRGDVVVFWYRAEPPFEDFLFISRIIGLPEERIEIKNGRVFVNNQVLDEPYYTGDTQGEISLTLLEDQFFVLGDNRQKAADSRRYGPINKEDIRGKILFPSE